MGKLAVEVRLNGAVVDTRVVDVEHFVRLGESPDAAVSFPGADLVVVRNGAHLVIRGSTLIEGESLSLSYGSVEIGLTHNKAHSFVKTPRANVDLHFLMTVTVVLVLGAWIDAASAWVQSHHSARVVSPAEDSIEALQLGGSKPSIAAVSSWSDASGEQLVGWSNPSGPRHVPDDHLTGTAYYSWYQMAVPNEPLLGEAFRQLEVNPEDSGARRVVARSAYNLGDYDVAAWHYRWLSERHPNDRDARLHLGWAEAKRGNHNIEVALYRKLLDDDPADVDALAGLAVALTRLGQLGEATLYLDELIVEAPMSPKTDLAVTIVEALNGQSRYALDALERTLNRRGQMTREFQLELCRTLAIDPALSGLRTGTKLRTLLHRHLGAAAPRPLG